MKLLTNSKNHMKMENSAIFVDRNSKINTLKIKNIAKLEIIVTIQVNIEVMRIAHLS